MYRGKAIVSALMSQISLGFNLNHREQNYKRGYVRAKKNHTNLGSLMTHNSRISLRLNSEYWKPFLQFLLSLKNVALKGYQDMPPQNLPLQHKNYFKMKTSEIQQLQKKRLPGASLI